MERSDCLWKYKGFLTDIYDTTVTFTDTSNQRIIYLVRL